MKLSSEVETLQPNISDFPKKPKKTFPWTKMASDGSELGTLVKLDPWEPLKLSIAKKILSNWITENMSPWAKSNPYSKLARSLVRNMLLKILPISHVAGSVTRPESNSKQFCLLIIINGYLRNAKKWKSKS